MIESKYVCTYDLFSSIPTFDESKTATQEIFQRNEVIKRRPVSPFPDGHQIDAPEYGLSERHILSLERMVGVRIHSDQDHGPHFSRGARQGNSFVVPALSYSTAVLTVAVASAVFGSGVTSVAVPVSVITLPDGAVTFTVSRSVHVVFGAIALFS